MPQDFANGKIYRLCHVPTDSSYLGSTACPLLSERLRFHFLQFEKLKRGGKLKMGELYPFMELHPNREEWVILLVEHFPCQSRLELLAREYAVIQAWPEKDKLLNVRREQFKVAESTREKMRNLERMRSPENLERLRALADAMKGVPLSPEHRDKMKATARAASTTLAYRRGDLLVSWDERKQAYRVRSLGQDLKSVGVLTKGRKQRSKPEALQLAIAWVDSQPDPTAKTENTAAESPVSPPAQ